MEGCPCAGSSPSSLEGDPRPVSEFRFPTGVARPGPRGVDRLSHDGRMGRRGRRWEGRVALDTGGWGGEEASRGMGERASRGAPHASRRDKRGRGGIARRAACLAARWTGARGRRAGAWWTPSLHPYRVVVDSPTR
jgi:hypothetical protein